LASSAEAGVGNAREWHLDTTPASNTATRSTIAITRLNPHLSGRMKVLGAAPPAKGVRAMSIGQRGPAPQRRLVDFDRINRSALAILPRLLERWLPDGKQQGREYLARNPKRYDRRAGSFLINVGTGKWADFATGDRGGDVISLAAFLAGISQREAAERLANMLGIETGRGR
jgi:hypothetical protein